MKYTFLLSLFAGLLFFTTVSAVTVIESGSKHLIKIKFLKGTSTCNVKNLKASVDKKGQSFFKKMLKVGKGALSKVMSKLQEDNGCQTLEKGKMSLDTKGAQITAPVGAILVAYKDPWYALLKGKVVNSFPVICDVKSTLIVLKTIKLGFVKKFMESKFAKKLNLHKVGKFLGIEGEGDGGLACHYIM